MWQTIEGMRVFFTPPLICLKKSRIAVFMRRREYSFGWIALLPKLLPCERAVSTDSCGLCPLFLMASWEHGSGPLVGTW